MQLRYLRTSPYVRKVMVCAHELGLADRIETIDTRPQEDEESLCEHNPLSKVPALITDDGEVLYDSPVVCEYLDALAGNRLFPPSGPARWTALRRHALADGILDAAVARRYESQRPEEIQHEPWVTRQKRKIERALDYFEGEADALAHGNSPITIGEIAVGCALGYLDLRFEADDWRRNRPALASWYEDFAERPSMRKTIPAD